MPWANAAGKVYGVAQGRTTRTHTRGVTRAEPNGWQVAVAVAVAAIVLANYHDTSALLRRVAFTIGA